MPVKIESQYKSAYQWINLTALGRHALCFTGQYFGSIAKPAPLTLRAWPLSAKPSTRGRIIHTFIGPRSVNKAMPKIKIPNSK